MKSPGTRSFLKCVGIVGALALLAVPLSALMVADSGQNHHGANGLSQASQLTTPVDLAVEGDAAAGASDAPSALSALMARSAVGADDNYLDLRHPASAFVP